MARLESTKRAKLKTAKQHQPSQKSKSLTCCYLLPRFWVTPYLVPIGTVDLKKKHVSIHKLCLSFPNKGGCSHSWHQNLGKSPHILPKPCRTSGVHGSTPLATFSMDCKSRSLDTTCPARQGFWPPEKKTTTKLEIFVFLKGKSRFNKWGKRLLGGITFLFGIMKVFFLVLDNRKRCCT